MIKFDWDDNKNRTNRKKHAVWFEEAQQVFDDPRALMFADPEHSTEEDRFLLLGMSGSSRILVVVYCERSEGAVVRIISARKAKPKEVTRYEEGV